jgi:NADH-quinone oxidoreductase subunit I/electron transport complex protein RnfC
MTIEKGNVITVDRGTGRMRAGQGLLKGLGVVWHHWMSSFRKLEDFSQTAGTFTTQYPDERLPLPEAYRNMPILLYDDETGHELCTSCFQCQRICPPQVIHMTQARDPNTGKAVPAVAEFAIEYDACMSCGFCAEVCPFDAIKMDHDFELSTSEHGGLTTFKEALNRPVSYYEKIAPTMWNEAKAGAYKKLQGNMKRRSGLIGIAPQMVEKVKALQAQQAASQPAAPAAEKPAAAEPPQNPADAKAAKLAAIRAANAAKNKTEGGESAPAEAEQNPADAKAAKLAAIRAANAAKKQQEGERESDPTTGDTAAPQDDKAARLAAIRAANAAKKQEGGAENAPAAPETAAPETAPQDEKAARLAAIRAANAAKKQQEGAGEAGSETPSKADEATPEAGGEQSGDAGKTVSDEKAARLAAIRAANAAKKQQNQEE